MRNGKKALLMIAGSLCASAMMALWPVEQALEVEAVVVEQGELVRSQMLLGTVCPAQETPYLSLKDGIISRVYVQAGEKVKKGDLLFKMDTAAEEQALKELYKMQQKSIPAIALGWQQKEAELLAAIEASQLRARTDGVMAAVYTEEGSMVAAMTMLGKTNGQGKRIAAAVPMASSSLMPGMTATADQIPLVLSSLTDGGEEGAPIAYFEMLQSVDAQAFRIGETVNVELFDEPGPISALVPLSAITAEETVWVVTDGYAYQEHLDVRECSRTHAAADFSWAGRTVVLHPARYELKEGSAVRVKQ